MLAVLAVYNTLKLHFYEIKLDGKGVGQWEELKHAVLGVIVLCNKFQRDLHCKES